MFLIVHPVSGDRAEADDLASARRAAQVLRAEALDAGTCASPRVHCLIVRDATGSVAGGGRGVAAAVARRVPQAAQARAVVSKEGMMPRTKKAEAPAKKPAARRSSSPASGDAKPKPAKEVAVEILRRKGGGPIRVSELAKLVVESGRTKLSGKTPEATVSAHIYTAAKAGVLFRKTGRGEVELLPDGAKAPAAKRESAKKPARRRGERPSEAAMRLADEEMAAAAAAGGEAVLGDGTVVDEAGEPVGIDQPAAAEEREEATSS